MWVNSVLKKHSLLLIITLNLLYMITGIYALLISNNAKAFYSNYKIFLDSEYIVLSNTLLTAGLITIVTSVFMYDESLRKQFYISLLLSVLFIVIIILEVTVFIGGFMLEHRILSLTNKTLTATMQYYNAFNQTELTVGWDQIQKTFKCCGVDKYTEWLEKTSNTFKELPLSCCTFPPGVVGMAICNKNSGLLHRTGCLEIFGVYSQDYAISIWRAGIETVFIQMLVIVMVSYLKMKSN